MYKIFFRKRAKKFIDSLPKNERVRVTRAVMQLPDGEDIKKIKGHEGFYRLRVGDYRILYTVDHGKLTVYVVDAGNRGQIYKRL